MSLPVEYFKTKTHITDLQNLRDKELFFIIRLFYNELYDFNQSEEFKLKGIIIACNEMKDLIKDIRFILNCYMDVINEYGLPSCHISNIERLLNRLDIIELSLKKIKVIRSLKSRVNDLVDNCLLYIRVLYEELHDFIYMEHHLWSVD